MNKFVAYYQSPVKSAVSVKGNFVFESDYRANSKKNLSDARIKMLELFGKDAVAWTVKKTERAQEEIAVENISQTELDFRDKPEQMKRKRKTVQRGLL